MSAAASPEPQKPNLSSVTAALTQRAHLFRFAAFAVAAMAINLLTQNAVLTLLAGQWFTVYAALVCGTGAGLVFKYIVDKNWVFDDPSTGIAAHSRKFAAYTATGILTTVVFWGVELAFHYIFQTHAMTVVGGVVGLTLGYVIKYNLDKWITFRAKSAP